MSRCVGLALLCFIASAFGCNRDRGDKAVTLKIAVSKAGAPLFAWDDSLAYESQTNGTVYWENGATAKGKFRRASWTAELTVDLIMIVQDDGAYKVAGTVDSPVPLRIEFLGSSPDGTPDKFQEFPPGKHALSFLGKLVLVYEKPEKP